VKEAIEKVKKFGREDLIKLFSNMDENAQVDLYRCEDYYDYSIRELVLNTNAIKGFDIKYLSPGLIIRFPDKNTLEISENFQMKHKLFKTHQLHDKWLNILKLHNVTSLNKRIKDKSEVFDIKKTILIEEALHENKIVEIASTIATKMKGIKLILIAGPSSSGKTTFAKRLDIQLRVEGLGTQVLNLDNYFVSRDRTPKKPNGEFDYESIHALDLDLLNSNLLDLMNGKEINLPKYDFKKGLSTISDKKMKLSKDDILIVEGIHGLNETLTESIPFYMKTKIYVSALNNLNIDSHNRIATTDSRKIRRIIRDSKYRKHSAEKTLSMWESVREGEDNNIFPYQENADFMFNSTLTYELGVLKEFAKKELRKIGENSPVYLEAQRLLKILSHFDIIDPKFVPLNSILREFIGGNIFDY
jgi:uridine kinase